MIACSSDLDGSTSDVSGLAGTARDPKTIWDSSQVDGFTSDASGLAGTTGETTTTWDGFHIVFGSRPCRTPKQLSSGSSGSSDASWPLMRWCRDHVGSSSSVKPDGILLVRQGDDTGAAPSNPAHMLWFESKLFLAGERAYVLQHATVPASRTLPRCGNSSADRSCNDRPPRQHAAAMSRLVVAAEKALSSAPRTAWDTSSDSDAPLSQHATSVKERYKAPNVDAHWVWELSESELLDGTPAASLRQCATLHSLGRSCGRDIADSTGTEGGDGRGSRSFGQPSSFVCKSGARRVLRLRHRVTGEVRMRSEGHCGLRRQTVWDPRDDDCSGNSSVEKNSDWVPDL